MARPIEFDTERALDAATRMFWEHGYSGTSLRQLLRGMGIGEGSFYNSFHGKSALFRRCLERYNATVGRRRLDALCDAPTAGEGVRALFRTVLDELDDPSTPRICLLAGSLSGDVPDEGELASYVKDEMEAFTGCFRTRLGEGVLTGELPADFDVEAAAGALVTWLQGLFRVIRVLVDRGQAERQLDVLLRGLGL